MDLWIEDENNENDVISTTIVINQLNKKAEQAEVKNLIDCYNPIICEATDVMRGHMLDMCKNWENKEEILNDTIRCVWPEIDMEYAELDKIDQIGKLIDTLLM